METKDVLLVIISLIAGYFVHYTAKPLEDRFKNWRSAREQKKAKESIEAATRRKTKLEKRLIDTERFLNDQTAFIAFVISSFKRSIRSSLLLGAIAGLVFIILFGTEAPIERGPQLTDSARFLTGPLLAILFMGILFDLGISEVVFIAEGILNFEEYKTNTEKQIAELQEVINQRQSQTEG